MITIATTAHVPQCHRKGMPPLLVWQQRSRILNQLIRLSSRESLILQLCMQSFPSKTMPLKQSVSGIVVNKNTSCSPNAENLVIMKRMLCMMSNLTTSIDGCNSNKQAREDMFHIRHVSFVQYIAFACLFSDNQGLRQYPKGLGATDLGSS
jgi:hypothetical protein